MTCPLWQHRQLKQRRVVCEKWKQIFKFKSSHWNGIQETFEIRKYKFELIKEMLEIWSGQIQEYLNQHPWLQVQVHDHHYSPKMTPFITSQRFRAGRLVFSPKRICHQPLQDKEDAENTDESSLTLEKVDKNWSNWTKVDKCWQKLPKLDFEKLESRLDANRCEYIVWTGLYVKKSN